jgi:hypothetical protein
MVKPSRSVIAYVIVARKFYKPEIRQLLLKNYKKQGSNYVDLCLLGKTSTKARVLL